MIDHDALARRIAEDIMTGDGNHAMQLDLVDNIGRTFGTWTLGPLTDLIARHLREALPTSEDVCEWTGGEWEMSCKWDTKCGKSFYFEDGSPTENGFHFCCFCGKKLIEVPFEEDEDFES